jgi:adenosine deaminase
MCRDYECGSLVLMNTLIPSGLVELHRHLDGSLRRSTLEELASAHGVRVPEDLLFRPAMGLLEALSRFEFTLSLLQTPEVVTRIADEMCADADAEGIDALEIRFAPQLHNAAPIAHIVDAALEGIDGRAGLILCGLYGEPPSVLDRLVELGRTRSGVVGLDLAGGPAPGSDWGMKHYGTCFAAARRVGLGTTVHAGEGRPVDEIRFALEHLQPDRIGHGCSLLEDMTVVEMVIERGVTIEACPTSNVHTGIIGSVAEHPIREWLALGVQASICTDNTLLSEVDLPTEIARVASGVGLTDDEVSRTVKYGRAAFFGTSR